MLPMSNLLSFARVYPKLLWILFSDTEGILKFATNATTVRAVVL
jgi:hypothetical protein